MTRCDVTNDIDAIVHTFAYLGVKVGILKHEVLILRYSSSILMSFNMVVLKKSSIVVSYNNLVSCSSLLNMFIQYGD